MCTCTCLAPLHSRECSCSLVRLALSARDVSTLLNRFSPVQDGQVHWKAFLGWVQPTLMVKVSERPGELVASVASVALVT